MAEKADGPKQPDPAKPVIAVEYDGKLYPTFQKAEAARATADLMPILAPIEGDQIPDYSGRQMFTQHGRMEAVGFVMANAERVHGILSRYLDAAKIEMPSNL